MNDELVKHRLDFLEKNMEQIRKDLQSLKDNQKDPKIYIALFSLFGVMFSTFGSIVGMLITGYLKAKGFF